jgi:hypothetical protein
LTKSSGGSSAAEPAPSKHQVEGSTPSPRSNSAGERLIKAAKQAAEIVKRGKGRPKSITDMKAYKAQKAKEKRQRDKAERASK